MVGGITFGDRIFYFEGNSWFVDMKNCLVASIQMNPNYGFLAKKKQLDYYEGHIYKVDEREIARFKREHYRKYNGISPASTQFQKICRLEGRWELFHQVDGQELFNIEKDFPYILQDEDGPLASDSSYREDIIAWKLNDFDFAMEQKEKLEVLQRNDKKLRQKHEKHIRK